MCNCNYPAFVATYLVVHVLEVVNSQVRQGTRQGVEAIHGGQNQGHSWQLNGKRGHGLNVQLPPPQLRIM